MHKEDTYPDKKVLVVDDNPMVHKMFASILKLWQVQFFSAINGAEAVTKALEISPDLIFLDIMMPEVDGFQALEMFRKMDQTAKTPIIIVTARADSATLVRAIKLGANDFIAKPFSKGMIKRKVRFAFMPAEDRERIETENIYADDSDKPTFISPSAFKEMKSTYLYKFDHIFISMIRLLSNRDKIKLTTLLLNIEKSCTLYDIQQPLHVIEQTKHLVTNSKWDDVMHQMEKLHTIFKDLQMKHESNSRNQSG